MRARSLAPLVVLLACSAGPAEPAGRASAAILGGRPSGEDEDAAVYIETVGDAGTLRCSGRLIAPRLVLSARHCFLKRKSEGVACNADGSPADLTDTTDLRPEPPEKVTVYVGSEKPGLRPVAVVEVLTMLEVTICRSDIAFLVLAEAPLDVRTPLRRAPVEFGEEISVSGWGYTSDVRDALPLRRSTLDALEVKDVGPGRIPPGTFAVAGNSLCLGDSGAVALIDGAVVGTYSRIDGDPSRCSVALTRNVFAAVSAQGPLVERAYEAIGEEPWYAGERPPWLAAPGATCSRDDECRAGVCDPASATCAEPCGDGGLACPLGRTCSEADVCVIPAAEDAGAMDAAPPSVDAASCNAASARTGLTPAVLLALVGLASLRRRVPVGARVVGRRTPRRAPRRVRRSRSPCRGRRATSGRR